MALSEKHRSGIYLRLVPIMGVEVAEAFMAQFPVTEYDRPVTEDFIRVHMAELRSEMRTAIADLRAELRPAMAELRGDVRIEMASHRAGSPMTERRSRTAPR